MQYFELIHFNHKELQALRIVLTKSKPVGYRAKILVKVDEALSNIEAKQTTVKKS